MFVLHPIKSLDELKLNNEQRAGLDRALKEYPYDIYYPRITPEKRLLLRRFATYLQDYLRFIRFIDSDTPVCKNYVYFFPRRYREAEPYLFDDYEITTIFDCRYACRLISLDYDWFVRWLKNITMPEVHEALRLMSERI
jgi:hypothetical protein